MKVTGFTFIRNAIKYGYPIEQAIRSVLPLCDDFVVAVGQSEDETLTLIKSIDPEKIKIVPTVWDDSLREGGKVLAVETDKAFQAIGSDADWCFYIQGDEVLHEKYLDTVRTAMHQWKDDKKVDGLLFNYTHFYGSYDYIGDSPRWYSHEIRVIRNNKNFYAYRDAQGFRKYDNKKLRVKPIDAHIYHYGWVKPPAVMQKKVKQFARLWHNEEWVDQNVAKVEEFDFAAHIDSLQKFKGTHPQVMQALVAEQNWQFDYDISYNHLSGKKKLKKLAKRFLGLDFSYRNYIKI